MAHLIRLAVLTGLVAAAVFTPAQNVPSQPSAPKEKLWPPWNQPPGNGVNFTVEQIDNVPDLHGDIVDPQLVIFFAGNQFMATAELMDAFRREHPDIQRIYWETLPPGILARQIEEGALILGNLRIAIKPDIYTAGTRRIQQFEKQGRLGRVETYAQGRLAIMVRRGNPKNVRSLTDLGRPDVRVAMPNPEWEGVGNLIVESYKKAGGQELANRIMQSKAQDGTTFLTHIHHRQTPLRIMLGESDAGVVWLTEAKFQQAIGNPIEAIDIPDKLNTLGTYQAAIMKDAPHAAAADAFLSFLVSTKGQQILAKYGFLPPPKP